MTAAILLLVVAVLYRLVTGYAGDSLTWLPNFAPVAAIALCGSIYLPKRLALALPLSILFLSDLLLNAHFGASLLSVEMLPRYAVLLAIALGAGSLRANPGLARILGASLIGSVLFYVVTNTGSWFANPAYAKTAEGWIQALWTGVPGYAPTWTFFRNSLVSDLLFSALFVACFSLGSLRQPARNQALAPQA